MLVSNLPYKETKEAFLQKSSVKLLLLIFYSVGKVHAKVYINYLRTLQLGYNLALLPFNT